MDTSIAISVGDVEEDDDSVNFTEVVGLGHLKFFFGDVIPEFDSEKVIFDLSSQGVEFSS